MRQVKVVNVEKYKKKRLKENIEEKLLIAEKQIEEGKTIPAEDVFKELEEKYEL